MMGQLTAWSFCLALAGCASLGARKEARYKFEFNLASVRGQYQTFACSASVTDLETNAQSTAPEARARFGDQARTSGDDTAPFPHLEITLSSEPNGRSATCTAALYSGAKLLGSDRTILRN